MFSIHGFRDLSGNRPLEQPAAAPEDRPAAPPSCACACGGARVDDPQGCDVVRELFALTDVRRLDEAVDYAARVVRATVGEFVAAPARRQDGGLPAIDIAVEFFVPPTVSERFVLELDRALTRRSPEYSAARRTEQVAPMRLTVLPPGSFHQWRTAFGIDTRHQHGRRWSMDRASLDGVVRQAQTGWREIPPIS